MHVKRNLLHPLGCVRVHPRRADDNKRGAMQITADSWSEDADSSYVTEPLK